jgi:hypothetical protein
VSFSAALLKRRAVIVGGRLLLRRKMYAIAVRSIMPVYFNELCIFDERVERAHAGARLPISVAIRPLREQYKMEAF